MWAIRSNLGVRRSSAESGEAQANSLHHQMIFNSFFCFSSRKLRTLWLVTPRSGRRLPAFPLRVVTALWRDGRTPSQARRLPSRHPIRCLGSAPCHLYAVAGGAENGPACLLVLVRAMARQAARQAQAKTGHPNHNLQETFPCSVTAFLREAARFRAPSPLAPRPCPLPAVWSPRRSAFAIAQSAA
ncbi:MAG: hypothetical protein JWO24_862 [Rhodospirillales bacterium]|jgi:hypothetical protein|nr:hypothetical protein [Rhodospirillales bacterium]